MKFLISIIMVLLLVNLFAQAEDPDKADPIAPSATAGKFNPDGTVRKIEVPAYAASAGVEKGNDKTKTQAGHPCKFDAQGRCMKSPTKSTVASRTGKVLKGGTGGTSTVPATTPGGAVDSGPTEKK